MAQKGSKAKTNFSKKKSQSQKDFCCLQRGWKRSWSKSGKFSTAMFLIQACPVRGSLAPEQNMANHGEKFRVVKEKVYHDHPAARTTLDRRA
jgi:hypothetical protein